MKLDTVRWQKAKGQTNYFIDRYYCDDKLRLTAERVKPEANNFEMIFESRLARSPLNLYIIPDEFRHADQSGEVFISKSCLFKRFLIYLRYK